MVVFNALSARHHDNSKRYRYVISLCKNLSSLFLLLTCLSISASIIAQDFARKANPFAAYNAAGLDEKINLQLRSATSPNLIVPENQNYSISDGMVYKESEYHFNPGLIPAGSDPLPANTPCNAHRWFAGDGWRQNTADNTVVNTWQPIVLSSPNLQPKGIVRCASSAETETGLTAYKGSYDIASNPIAAILPQTDCFNGRRNFRQQPFCSYTR